MSNAVDVLIIGAGQAALALGQALAGGPWQYQLLQRHARVGDSWRRRYDSLVLFTPRSYSALPGMPVPGAPEGYASKDEIADYLEAYAARFALPIATSTGVRSLVRTATGYRAITDTGRSIDARAVVIATGGFQGRHWHTLRDAFGTHAALFGVTRGGYRRGSATSGSTRRCSTSTWRKRITASCRKSSAQNRARSVTRISECSRCS